MPPEAARGSSSTGDSGVPGVTAASVAARPTTRRCATLRAGLPATGAAKSPKFNALQKVNGATASGPAGGVTAWTRDVGLAGDALLAAARRRRQVDGLDDARVVVVLVQRECGPDARCPGALVITRWRRRLDGPAVDVLSSWSEPNEGSLFNPSSEKEASEPALRFCPARVSARTMW